MPNTTMGQLETCYLKGGQWRFSNGGAKKRMILDCGSIFGGPLYQVWQSIVAGASSAGHTMILGRKIAGE